MTKLLSIALVLPALFVVAFRANTACAADGNLDPTFGNGGTTFFDMGGTFDDVDSIVVESDKSLIISGIGASNRNVVTKLQPNGQPDLSFATAGKLVLPESVSPTAKSTAAGADAVYVGYAGYNVSANALDARVAKVLPNGALDGSFGTGGVASILPAATTQLDINDIVTQSDGKILVVGSAFVNSKWDFMVSRFNSNGTPDNSFGSGGMVLTDFGRAAIATPIDRASSVAIQPDGKILVGGFTSNTLTESTGNREFALARYLGNGTLDSTFGSGGKDVLTFGSGSLYQEDASSLIVLPSGKILVGNDGGSSTSVIQLNENGSLNTLFANAGQISASIPGQFFSASDIALDAHGRLLIAGGAINYVTGTRVLDVFRYDLSGQLDTSFHNTGLFSTSVHTSFEQAMALSIQPDGKILAGGYSWNPNVSGDGFVVRLSPEPSAVWLGTSGVLVAIVVAGIRKRTASHA